MRARKAILGIALAAVAALGVAPAAQASDAAGPAICHSATVGSKYVGSVCIEWDAGLMSVATVYARAWISVCVSDVRPSCRTVAGGVDQTGFEPRTVFPAPRINRAGSTVYWPGGPIGTVWIDGAAHVVTVGEVCLGNQAYCP